VAWVLWKFEGNTIVLCNQAANWVSNSSPNVTAKTVRDLAGCGDGFYTVQTYGMGLVDGVWVGGSVQSGWLELDVNDNPPPI
jgi:hypothetical protein